MPVELHSILYRCVVVEHEKHRINNRHAFSSERGTPKAEPACVAVLDTKNILFSALGVGRSGQQSQGRLLSNIMADPTPRSNLKSTVAQTTSANPKGAPLDRLGYPPLVLSEYILHLSGPYLKRYLFPTLPCHTFCNGLFGSRGQLDRDAVFMYFSPERREQHALLIAVCSSTYLI